MQKKDGGENVNLTINNENRRDSSYGDVGENRARIWEVIVKRLFWLAVIALVGMIGVVWSLIILVLK